MRDFVGVVALVLLGLAGCSDTVEEPSPVNDDTPDAGDDVPFEPPTPCDDDSECAPAEVCVPCAGPSCEGCKDCVQGCAPHACPTEPQPACDQGRPDCGEGALAVVRDGCWVCVDGMTCEDDPTPPPVRCQVDAECPATDYCDPCAGSSCPECDDCLAGCLPHACETQPEAACDEGRPNCGDGNLAVVRDGCWVCVDRRTCRPANVERDLRCDDGDALVCNQEPPTCQDFEILSIQSGCFECVNPETCRPWGEAQCRRDAECPNDARCDECASSSCPNCEDCVPACAPHACETAEAACDEARPECDQGVAVVRDGCWVCVSLDTCEPIEDDRLTTCDEGPLECDQLQPDCEDFEIVAVQDGCWVCVNPLTCRPWGEPGCATDLDCADNEDCNGCGTSSCPFCDDCVPACTSHMCPTEEVLDCFCSRPDCGFEGVAVIQAGCWVCVDPFSCEETQAVCE